MKNTVRMAFALAIIILIQSPFYISAQEYKIQLQSGHTQLYTQYGVVSKIQFSSDSRYLLTGGNEGKAILWDVASGRQIRSYANMDESIVAMDLTVDRKYLSLYPGEVYDIQSGDLVFRPASNVKTYGGVNQNIFFDPKSNRMLMIGDGNAQCFQLPAWSKVSETVIP